MVTPPPSPHVLRISLNGYDFHYSVTVECHGVPYNDSFTSHYIKGHFTFPKCMILFNSKPPFFFSTYLSVIVSACTHPLSFHSLHTPRATTQDVILFIRYD